MGVLFGFNGDDSTVETKHDKILLIGIDGADPRVMSELMKEGKLPNFAYLKNTGTYTALETSVSPQSPIAWASLATGTNPGKHNIFDFIRRDPENYLPELSLVKSKGGVMSTRYEPYVRGTSFWKITSDAGVPSTIIKWPLTFPPEELKGNMLSGLGVPDIRGRLNSYSFYTSEEKYTHGEGAEKVIKVDIEGNKTNTEIIGPKTKKGRQTVDIKIPMQIELSPDGESAKLIIQDNEYNVDVNGESNWIRIQFKVNFLSKVNGVCRFYLLSTSPFEMYMTTLQIDPEKPIQPISYPNDYSKELSKVIGIYNTLGLPEDVNALNEKKINDEIFLKQVENVDEEMNKIFWYEFERFDEGIFAIVFTGSDRVQHMFWDEKVFEDGSGELVVNPVVEDYYIKKDKFLGEVIDSLDSETVVFVFSDHGFTSFERAVNINKWLAENDYMHLKREPTEYNTGELFEFVDWSKTKAYSVGFSSIYINVKGREGQGIVDQEAKDLLIDEIISKLNNLTDEETGKKVIIKAYKASEVYSGNYIEEAPDIIIGFAPGYRMGWQSAIGGVTPKVLYNNTKHWRGDHIVDPSVVPGVLFANLKIEKAKPHLIDIAPTILTLQGLDVPSEMDGESLVNVD